ncbi:MAG TPA: hypothetical protein VKR53_05660 [Puia sp.]|nr:hypothetical protein [Puia sp.]
MKKIHFLSAVCGAVCFSSAGTIAFIWKTGLVFGLLTILILILLLVILDRVMSVQRPNQVASKTAPVKNEPAGIFSKDVHHLQQDSSKMIAS